MRPKLNKLIKEKQSITFRNWHSVIPMRADNNRIYLMLYGTKDLKEGSYSIKNDFSLQCFSISDSSVNGVITVPISAITIYRRDWGFELYLDRTKITNIKTGTYDGIAIVAANELTIEST